MLLLGAVTLFLRRLPQRVLFLCLSDAVLFLLGAQLTIAADERNSRWHYTHYLKQDGKQTWLVVPDDLPRHTTKFTRCRVKLLAVQQGKSWQEVSGGALLYIRHSGADSLLQPGTQLVVKAQLQPLPAALNPGEFDYKAYMRQRNIYHAAFADSGALVILPGRNPLHPVWAAGLACKQTVLRNLKHSGLSSDAYAVCAALLTGYDDDIDPELMRSFAHSGTLHVLSVSGLHTGLIYLLLNLLLDVFDRHRRYGKLRFALLTGLLWGFALLTGFPPPVLRAVIQLNLLGLGAIWFRSPGNNQLNLLLVSASALLVYQPFFICDLGFLLSYSAMIGLICLQPQLGALWQPKHMLLRLFWQSVSASAAATVSTLPLTLFFFKQFPIWFALMNLVVVPLTFVMLFLALLVLVHAPFVTALANLLMRFLSWCVTLSDSPGLGFVDGLDVDLADACLMAVFILLLALAWRYHRPPVLLAAWVVLLGWQLLALQRSWSAKHSSHVTIYALRGRSQLAVKNRNTLLMDTCPQWTYERYLQPGLAALNYPDTAALPRQVNFIAGRTKRLLVLRNSGQLPATWPTGVTALLVGAAVPVHVNLLKEHCPQLTLIVVDGGCNRRVAQRVRGLCDSLHLRFHNTLESGALRLSFD